MKTPVNLPLILFVGGLVIGMALGLWAMAADEKGRYLINTLNTDELYQLGHLLMIATLAGLLVCGLTILLVRGCYLIFLTDDN